jgi:DNA repair protein RadC
VKPTATPRPSHRAQAYLARVKESLRQRKTEQFHAIGFDTQGEIVMDISYSDGDPLAVHPDVAQIAHEAAKAVCVAVAALHNHPGGTADLSEQDDLMTGALRNQLGLGVAKVKILAKSR